MDNLFSLQTFRIAQSDEESIVSDSINTFMANRRNINFPIEEH